MNEHEKEAVLYLALFDSFASRFEELDCKRYNKEFLSAYSEVKSETAPIVLMFNAFVAGLDMGREIIEKLYANENAPTEKR